MRVIIDGSLFGSPTQRGITRYWKEWLSAFPGVADDVRLDLVIPPGARGPENLPGHRRGGIRAWAATRRAEVFHAAYYELWPRRRRPAVITVYDMIDLCLPLCHPNARGFIERQVRALREADAVIAISRATRDLACATLGLDPGRIRIAYPGVAPIFASPPTDADEKQAFRQRYTEGEPYLLHVGGRNNYKNFRTLLKAYVRAAGQTRRHLLLLGGKQGLADDALDWVYAADLQNRIHLHRTIDDRLLKVAYAGADALVQASLMEGFGIPVIEALACGTGVILSDIPVYREIAGAYARFVPAMDSEAWADAMASDVPVQPAWREEVLERYSWQETARVHAEVYRAVCQPARRAGTVSKNSSRAGY